MPHLYLEAGAAGAPVMNALAYDLSKLGIDLVALGGQRVVVESART